MDRWVGKVAVVTGANSGIGAAIAKDLVEAGMKVVGIDIAIQNMKENVTMMDTSKSGDLFPIQCDLTKEQEILDAFSWIGNNLGGVDVLINCAGISKKNLLTNPGNTEDLRHVLEVNVMALCICTREAFNSMKNRGVAGHIIHINSLLGHRLPFHETPFLNIYAASKQCVTALTEVLRQEMIYLSSKTKITSISPGVVSTRFLNKAFGVELAEDISKKLAYLNPEDISQAALYVLGTPEHVQVHEIIIKPIGEKC